MRQRNHLDTAVGEDSFLDTTANLVGILIILVVVIGTKTKIDAEAYSRQMLDDEPSAELLETASKATALHSALAQQSVKLQEYDLETEYRRLERNRVLQLVSLAREATQSRLEEVDEKKRESVEHRQALDQLRAEMQDISEQMGIADQHQRPKVVLEHLPTPMAKTVFNREMHIQLKAGMLTVIPWERLVDVLKEQVPLAARRNASRNKLADTLGPIGGFLMQYQMSAIPGGFELERFELETVAGAPTESLEKAFASTGRLRLELASRDPAETVVTVWVYPDSFEEFRQLKIRLYREGFLCAARPLPDGIRIGASPRGTRSSAQ